MQYVISFLEGIITFISPCLLPMLPIYISYFAGGGERTTRKTLLGALGFVSGFSVIFVAMGALAGTIGSFLREYQTMVNVISGLVVILFGLNFLGIFKWNLFRGGGKTVNSHEMGFFSAMLFGMVFSLGWTPCVGAFLGSALMLASQQGHVIKSHPSVVLTEPPAGGSLIMPWCLSYAGSCPVLTAVYRSFPQWEFIAFTTEVAAHHGFVTEECIFSFQSSCTV